MLRLGKFQGIADPGLRLLMSRQASSEREKRATIIKADGDRQAAAALAEAALTMAASPGAMQLRTLQTIDGLGPSSSNLPYFFSSGSFGMRCGGGTMVGESSAGACGGCSCGCCCCCGYWGCCCCG